MLTTVTSKDNTLKVGRVCNVRVPYSFSSMIFMKKPQCELKKGNKVVILPHPSYLNRYPITTGKVLIFVLPTKPLENETNRAAGEYLFIPRSVIEPSDEILVDWYILSEHVVYKIAQQFHLDKSLFKKIVADKGVNFAMNLLQQYLGKNIIFKYTCGCGWYDQSTNELIRCPSCGGEIYGTKIT